MFEWPRGAPADNNAPTHDSESLLCSYIALFGFSRLLTSRVETLTLQASFLEMARSVLVDLSPVQKVTS